MITFEQTREFAKWLSALKDKTGQARILARLKAAGLGHFADCECVGGGVYEMRIHCGPGYRVYYTRQGDIVVILLCGGDKGSQERDIERAKALAKEI